MAARIKVKKNGRVSITLDAYDTMALFMAIDVRSAPQQYRADAAAVDDVIGDFLSREYPYVGARPTPSV